MSRSILWVLVAAIAAGAGLLLGQRFFNAAPSAAVIAPPAPTLRAVRLLQSPRAIADFTLTAADGRPLTTAMLRGRWTLVFLGFTHCPDVCPTTLSELARAQLQWQALPQATRPRVLFVSVDPARDTPKATGDYAAYFHPETLAATGEEPALTNFAQTLGLVYMKVPGEGEDYSMDHSATLVLLDPQGRMAGLIRPPLKPEAIASDLKLLSEMQP